MVAETNTFTTKETLKYDQALHERLLHHGKEVLGLALVGSFIVLFYGLLSFSKGDIGTNAIKMIDHFVEHAIGSINVSQLTAAIFVFSVTVLFEGAPFAKFLRSFIVQPLLNLFQHSCALTLGVIAGYLLLMLAGLEPREEFGNAVVIISLMLVTITVCALFRTIFEVVVGKGLCEHICAAMILKFFPKFASSPDKLKSAISTSVNGIFVCVGTVLLITSVWQIPIDLRTATKSFDHVPEKACEAPIGYKK